jgi:nitrate/TMAO reductase-like tetraheme cytochrome c subunit
VNFSVHSGIGCGECHRGLEGHPEEGVVSPVACGVCHEKIAEKYSKSVHGEIAVKKLGKRTPDCITCHGDHRMITPKAIGFKKNIHTICGKCHEKEDLEYRESIHFTALSEGIEEAPSCTDCHIEHEILPKEVPLSPVYATNIPKTCGKCHEGMTLSQKYGVPSKRYTTYAESFHGIALQYGNLVAANCASCHGNHLILPRDDPRSPVNPANLVKTCGRCHPGASANFAKGRVHVEPRKSVSPGVFYVRLFYTVFIASLVFFFLLHILFDIRKKFRKGEET